MPLFWLRIAVILYGVGLLYSFLGLSRKSEWLSRFVIPATALGALLHLVSLVETTFEYGHIAPTTVHHSESLLAFLCMALFLAVWAVYRTTAFGIFVFPLVFLLTFAASIGQQPQEFTSQLLRKGWIVAHVALIFAGYAALFLSFVASIVYLLQERGLKAKSSGTISRLPALEVIDQIGYRALILGFPFMTVGLIAGSVVAQAQFGSTFFLDPKILLSLLMWAVYMLLLFTRWNSGWRGRRAAFLSSFAFLIAVGAWAANYFSGVHKFLQL